MGTVYEVAKPIKDATQAPVNEPLGWRYETVRSANGTEESVRVPLTPEEARHPKEGYVMPERTEHDFISDDLCDMLRAYYREHSEIAVFRNLVFEWNHPSIGNYAPDIAVVPNVRTRDANRTSFKVSEEGTRPNLVIEIVSRTSRKEDRVDKVRDYAALGIQEYVYIDLWERRGVPQRELAGFRLEGEHYLPLLPDEDGAIYLLSVDLRIGLDENRVWLEDSKTGNDLLTNIEARVALKAAEERAAAEEVARQAAEERAEAEEKARQAAEAQVAELKEQLRLLRSQSNTGQ